MIREALEKIFYDYPRVLKEEFASHTFAKWVRHDLPQIFKDSTPKYPDFKWVASPGRGDGLMLHG